MCYPLVLCCGFMSVSKEEKKRRAREQREGRTRTRRTNKKFPIVTEVVKVRIDCRSQVLLWVEPFFKMK